MNLEKKNLFRVLLSTIFILFIVFTSGIMKGLNLFLANKGYVIMNIFIACSIYVSLFYIIYYYLIRKNINLLIGNIRMFFMLLVFFILGLYASINMDVTLKGIFILTGFVLLSIVLIDQFEDKEIYKILAIGFISVMIINLIFIIIWPEYSYDAIDRRFKRSLIGMFYHKNSMASFMALTNIIVLISLSMNTVNSKLKKYALSIIYILTIICTIMSNSTTSLLLMIGCSGIFLAYRWFKVKFNIINWLVTFNLIFYTIILGSQFINKLFMAMFGRDLTLTGRIDIWRVLLELIDQKPFIGYGYNSIWNTPEIISYINSTVGFEFMGTHNGPIHILIELGLIGFIIFFIIFFVIPSFKIKYLHIDSNPLHMYIYIFYAYILIYCISEGTFVPENFQTLLLILSTIYINKFSIKDVNK